MRLTATDPTDGMDLMEVNGAGPVGYMLNGGCGRPMVCVEMGS
jgi:hypothetical protein